MRKTSGRVVALLFLLVALSLVVFPHMVHVSSASTWSAVLHVTGRNESASAVVGVPTVSAAFLDQVLAAYHSPAAGFGSALYADGVQFGIDPVYGLAFFLHEDGMGTTGWGAHNHSLGNIRCSTGYVCQGGYRCYPTWAAGFWDWFHLIRVLYLNTWHLVTVAQIIPVYAPSSDHNDVQGYIAAIQAAVDAWRAGRIEV
jgi:hypothetical protein